MKVAVGSANPTKVTAVTRIFQKVWPNAQICSVDVASGVSSMPMSDAESLQGAANRATAALAALNADFGVGLEGGVQPEAHGLTLHGWVVIVDVNGKQGIGGAARLPLPEPIARRVFAGEELGHVMDDVLQEHNTKHKGGAVGALTAGLVVRGEAFATAVAYALAPFISSHLYAE